jgi:hypothetical protein
MCCYPGLCNDRNLDVVCPSLSSGNREFRVYPNPTSENINVIIKGNKSKILKLELFNQFGLLVMVKEIEIAAQDSFNLGLQNLDNGVYMLKAISENDIYNRTIIKQ